MSNWKKFWSSNPIEKEQYIDDTNNTLIIKHEDITHTLLIPSVGYKTTVAIHESMLVDKLNELIKGVCDFVTFSLGVKASGIEKEVFVVFNLKNSDTKVITFSGNFIDNLVGNLEPTGN